MNPTSRNSFELPPEFDLRAEIERGMNRAHQQRAVYISLLFKGLLARWRIRWSQVTKHAPRGQEHPVVPAKAGTQYPVIPAKAGIQYPVIPAKAGIQCPVIPAKAGIQ